MAKSVVVLSDEEKQVLKNQISEKFQDIINLLNNFDNEIAPHQHIAETPMRIAKMFVDELMMGCFTEAPSMKTFKNDNPESNAPVIIDNIQIKSLCSHHFVPFKGNAIVYYVPGEKVSGLSKFSRICEYYARRPQIQEEMTKQIVNHFNRELQPKFVAVAISAQHLCMTHRGANEYNSSCKTFHYILNDKSLYNQSELNDIQFYMLKKLDEK